MATKHSKFSNWINEQLDQREWRPADLARVGNINTGLLSRIISGSRSAGPQTCIAIAQAFKLPPEQVFRIAGILPPLSPAVEEEQEAVRLLRGLSPERRAAALEMLRGLGKSSS